MVLSSVASLSIYRRIWECCTALRRQSSSLRHWLSCNRRSHIFATSYGLSISWCWESYEVAGEHNFSGNIHSTLLITIADSCFSVRHKTLTASFPTHTPALHAYSPLLFSSEIYTFIWLFERWYSGSSPDSENRKGNRNIRLFCFCVSGYILPLLARFLPCQGSSVDTHPIRFSPF